MFDWFASVSSAKKLIGCSIELDTSTGEIERAGVYLQQHGRHALVAPFLERIGEAERARSYLDVLARMPEGWPPAYVGLFPGRPGSPLRIGGYLGSAELERCAKSPEYLGDLFRQIGFGDFDTPMLERCAELMGLSPSADFQFDIMADGSLGDTFGLALSFNETKPNEARTCMESGQGARLMHALEDWNLVDDRWKLLSGAAFARHVGYERDDGTEGRFALCIRFNYAKVKFTGCVPQPAKFYLACEAGDVEA